MQLINARWIFDDNVEGVEAMVRKCQDRNEKSIFLQERLPADIRVGNNSSLHMKMEERKWSTNIYFQKKVVAKKVQT